MRPNSPQQFAVRFLIGTVLFALLGLLLLPNLARSREASRRASCQNNLKQMGIIFKMYSNESNGYLPMLSPIPDNWIPNPTAIAPEYLTDTSVLRCPTNPFESFETSRRASNAIPAPKRDCIASTSYIYTGKAIYCDEQAVALFDASANWSLVTSSTADLTLDVPVWPNSDRGNLPAGSDQPLMWDRIPADAHFMSHVPAGINVLHFDGHVEFVKYSPYNNSNFFPCTRVTAETFGSVVPRLPNHCY